MLLRAGVATCGFRKACARREWRVPFPSGGCGGGVRQPTTTFTLAAPETTERLSETAHGQPAAMGTPKVTKPAETPDAPKKAPPSKKAPATQAPDAPPAKKQAKEKAAGAPAPGHGSKKRKREADEADASSVGHTPASGGSKKRKHDAGAKAAKATPPETATAAAAPAKKPKVPKAPKGEGEETEGATPPKAGRNTPNPRTSQLYNDAKCQHVITVDPNRDYMCAEGQRELRAALDGLGQHFLANNAHASMAFKQYEEGQYGTHAHGQKMRTAFKYLAGTLQALKMASTIAKRAIPATRSKKTGVSIKKEPEAPNGEAPVGEETAAPMDTAADEPDNSESGSDDSGSDSSDSEEEAPATVTA